MGSVNCKYFNICLIYWFQVQLLMNQAFGSPLQGLPASPLDLHGCDSDSMASTPDNGGFSSVCQRLEVDSVGAHVPDARKGNNINSHDEIE
jgi:hypothetical protein